MFQNGHVCPVAGQGTVHVEVMGDDRGHLKKSLKNQLESFGSGDTFPNVFFRQSTKSSV